MVETREEGTKVEITEARTTRVKERMVRRIIRVKMARKRRMLKQTKRNEDKPDLEN
jgi:hypothetical protein